MSKILTSDEFIQSVRRRCMAPENTEVYDDMDILEIASEEIAVEIMPALLSIHEGYMLTHIDISIEQDKNKYRIPERAVANKLKDVCLVDTSGNVFELTEIDVGRLSDYSTSYTTGFETGIFYVENDEVTFLSNDNIGYAFIRMYFYIRPSNLVEMEFAGRVSSVSVGATETIITLENFPTAFTNISTNLFDIVSGKNPNKIYNYDIEATAVNKNSSTITFTNSDVSENIQAGDFICFASETVVPQVPVEWHPVLAQTVAVHILEGLGDEQGKASAERKLERMMRNLTTLFERRIEESSKKIVSRHSVIADSLGGIGRRFGRRY